MNEGISVKLDEQTTLIYKANEKAEVARIGLEKRSSELEQLLTKYRTTGNCWKDVVLVLILGLLIAANYYALKFWLNF